MPISRPVDVLFRSRSKHVVVTRFGGRFARAFYVFFVQQRGHSGLQNRCRVPRKSVFFFLNKMLNIFRVSYFGIPLRRIFFFFASSGPSAPSRRQNDPPSRAAVVPYLCGGGGDRPAALPPRPLSLRGFSMVQRRILPR